jgi:hypothetical protein
MILPRDSSNQRQVESSDVNQIMQDTPQVKKILRAFIENLQYMKQNPKRLDIPKYSAIPSVAPEEHKVRALGFSSRFCRSVLSSPPPLPAAHFDSFVVVALGRGRPLSLRLLLCHSHHHCLSIVLCGTAAVTTSPTHSSLSLSFFFYYPYTDDLVSRPRAWRVCLPQRM